MSELPTSDSRLVPGWPPAPAIRLLLPAITVAAEESERIDIVATHLAALVAAGGRVYTFGAGHAVAFAAELCSRAGGISAFLAISLEDLRPLARPAHIQFSDSVPERTLENGPALLNRYGVGATDGLLIASQSGRNAAAIEMARNARARGTYTIGVVSVLHCRSFPSRHPEGIRLIDVVDEVIDNHCPVGDATLVESNGERICATSTISFALIAQLINARVIHHLMASDRAPQVIRSANVDVAND